jgi:hypothetical protein
VLGEEFPFLIFGIKKRVQWCKIQKEKGSLNMEGYGCGTKGPSPTGISIDIGWLTTNLGLFKTFI